MKLDKYIFHLLFVAVSCKTFLCAGDAEKDSSFGKLEYHEIKQAEHQNYFKSVLASLGSSKGGTGQDQKVQGSPDLLPVAKYFNKKVLKHKKAIDKIRSGNTIEGPKTLEHITKKRKRTSEQTSHSQKD